MKNAPSLLAETFHLTGDLQDDGELQIDGSIEGNVQAMALTIGPNGRIKGTAKADRVEVHGKIEGNIEAKSLILEGSAKIDGDILYEQLEVKSGAIINGKISVIQDNKKNTYSQASKSNEKKTTDETAKDS